MKELWEEISNKIWINDDGGIVYDTLFQKKWEAAGLSTHDLHAAIEDNIVPDEDNDAEMIDWAGVEKTFKEMMGEE